jgi:hypothetical protein
MNKFLEIRLENNVYLVIHLNAFCFEFFFKQTLWILKEQFYHINEL